MAVYLARGTSPVVVVVAVAVVQEPHLRLEAPCTPAGNWRQTPELAEEAGGLAEDSQVAVAEASAVAEATACSTCVA